MKKGMISGCGIFIIMLFTAALFSTPLLAAEFTAKNTVWKCRTPGVTAWS